MQMFDSSMPFFKGNLHAHTTNSDGRRTPQEVIELYKAHGYDFLALTDHWKRTVEEPYYDEGMLLLPVSTSTTRFSIASTAATRRGAASATSVSPADGRSWRIRPGRSIRRRSLLRCLI